MNTRSVLLVTLALAPQIAMAQDDSRTAGPTVSGWIHVDFGFGSPHARCSDCSLHYGGPGFAGGIGTGLTVRKASIGIEQHGMGVLGAASRNTSRFRMLTLGVESSPRLVLRAGAGTGRYKLDPTVLVDDRLAGMVGIEYRPRGRADSGIRLEWLQTARGEDVLLNGVPERYSLRAIRIVGLWRLTIGN